jgi:hypothetical protein
VVAGKSGGENGEMTEEVVRFDVIERRDNGVLGLISASLLEQDFGYGVLHFQQSTITKIFDSQMFFFSFFRLNIIFVQVSLFFFLSLYIFFCKLVFICSFFLVLIL